MNHRIPILFDRALLPEWIDFALEQYLHTSDETAFKKVLIEHLEPEFNGKDALRKTIDQIQRVVGYRSLIAHEKRAATYSKMINLPPDKRADLRLQLLLESSPFVTDCFDTLKRLDILGVNGIEIKLVKERVSALYGDRYTVYRCVERAFQTLASFGFIESRDKKWYLTIRD